MKTSFFVSLWSALKQFFLTKPALDPDLQSRADHDPQDREFTYWGGIPGLWS